MASRNGNISPDAELKPVPAMEPLAAALEDHFRLDHSVEIEFRRDDGVWYAQSTDQYFTVPQWLIEIEKNILDLVHEPVLDVGAASGRHAIFLQQKLHQVTAIDSTYRCVELMRRRGVRDARAIDIFDLEDGHWHSVLFMMETIGLVGTIHMLEILLTRLHRLITDNGQILLDARPLQSEGGSGEYEGELELQMRYRNLIGEVFRWLYIDFDMLESVAANRGWRAELIYTDQQTEAYATRLIKKA